jgi:hypothetical protein
MNRRKRNYITAALFILVLLSSIYIITSFYIKHKRYETYLNEIVLSQYRVMKFSILDADVLLGFIVEQKAITKEQADELYFDYHEFAYAVDGMENLYVNIRDEQKLFNPINQYHFEYYDFFEHLKDEMDKKNETRRELSDDEISYYKRMFTVTEGYTDIVDKYRKIKFSITKEEYVELLKKLANIDSVISAQSNSSSL